MKRPHKGKGAGVGFLRELIGQDGDACVTWPMFRDPNGYGRVGYNGKQCWAHRLACEFVNGPPPTPKHEASHSCGNGKLGCVNPRHLSWKTTSENQLERRLHGTHSRGVGYRWRLTPEQVATIRANPENKTEAQFAAMYGVAAQTIGKVKRGETWKTGQRVVHGFPAGPDNPSVLRAKRRALARQGTESGVS